MIVLDEAISWCFKSKRCICGFLDEELFEACSTDNESEKITNLFVLLQFFTKSKAKSIALASAVKTEEPSGIHICLQSL